MVAVEIVNKAQNGDRDALIYILKEIEQSIYKTAFYLTKNEADAKDLTQDALLRVYQKFSSFKGDASVKVWAQRIATNLFLDSVRKKKVDIFSLDNNEAYHYIADEDSDVAEKVESKMKNKKVHEAIVKLPEQYKLVIVLRYLQDFSYKEISESLAIPENTVKTHLFRARKMLKDLLKETLYEEVY